MKWIHRRVFMPALCLVIFNVTASTRLCAAPDTWQVFIGTYTGGDSKGIYRLDLDMKTGAVSPAVMVAETPNPSFLAVHPSGRFIYAANELETFKEEPTGSVSAFEIGEDGHLTFLNEQASGGGAPCHVLLDKAGRHVFAANYSGGSISVFPVQADGRLDSAVTRVQHQGSSVNPKRQKGPHAHGIYLGPGERHVLVADLGLDQVLVYRYNPKTGGLIAAEPPHASVKPGAGPRHLAIHPRGGHVYVLNEIDCTITPFKYQGSRGLARESDSVSTLPAGVETRAGFSTAEIAVHPSGRFLYSSNRGHDTIAVFALEKGGSLLRPVEHEATGGRTPRNFGIDPTGTYLLAANQSSGNVVVFRIDPKSGELTPTGHEVKVPNPVCVVFRQPD